LLFKEFLEEKSLSWEGLDQSHQVKSPTKVRVGKPLLPSIFTSVLISAEVKHAPDKGISCPVLYIDPASAGCDKADE